jgi:hypothetical protein
MKLVAVTCAVRTTSVLLILAIAARASAQCPASTDTKIDQVVFDFEFPRGGHFVDLLSLTVDLARPSLRTANAQRQPIPDRYARDVSAEKPPLCLSELNANMSQVVPILSGWKFWWRKNVPPILVSAENGRTTATLNFSAGQDWYVKVQAEPESAKVRVEECGRNCTGEQTEFSANYPGAEDYVDMRLNFGAGCAAPVRVTRDGIDIGNPPKSTHKSMAPDKPTRIVETDVLALDTCGGEPPRTWLEALLNSYTAYARGRPKPKPLIFEAHIVK